MECAICHQQMNANEEDIRMHTNQVIPHVFHINCINRWYAEGHNTCPICREEVRLDDWVVVVDLPE